MIVISIIVLFCIAAVYIKNFLLEQHYENCRHYAQGAVDVLRVCRHDCYPIYPLGGRVGNIDIPADFGAKHLEPYRGSTLLSQRYYRAYLHCMKKKS